MEYIKRLEQIKYPSGQVKWKSLYKCPYCKKLFIKLETTIYKSTTDHCGCKNNPIINWKYGPELKSRWHGMLMRTVNGKFKRPDSYNNGPYKDVTVCDEWNKSFKAYYDWAIKNNFEPSLHMDRIDGKKGYGPDNCRFITQQENNRNGARSKLNINTVREIMFLYGIYRNIDIARIYNITPAVVVNISTGVIWKDIYKLYGKPKTNSKLNYKFTLPINNKIKPGFIDFNNKNQLNSINNGFLALEDDKKYKLLDLSEIYNMYRYYDDSTFSYKHFFSTIEMLSKHPESYEMFLRKTHSLRLSKLKEIRYFFKRFIKKELIDNYITLLSGYKVIVKSTSLTSVPARCTVLVDGTFTYE